jgi:hypothetical protein
MPPFWRLEVLGCYYIFAKLPTPVLVSVLQLVTDKLVLAAIIK